MITLDGHSLSVAEVWQVANRRVPCSLSAAARPFVRRSRQFVDRLALTPHAIYGINTGFGPLSGFRVSNEDQTTPFFVTSSWDTLFSVAESHALVLANTLARGF
jgi:histidine ammonia-lyase